MNAYIYLRVSTAIQAEEGISMETQEARCRAWATANGYTIAGVFSDKGISGKRASNRPGLLDALRAATATRGNVLVCYSLSRLARSTRDAIMIAERLERAGADLVSLSEKVDTTNAAGRMFFKMAASGFSVGCGIEVEGAVVKEDCSSKVSLVSEAVGDSFETFNLPVE